MQSIHAIRAILETLSALSFSLSPANKGNKSTIFTLPQQLDSDTVAPDVVNALSRVRECQLNDSATYCSHVLLTPGYLSTDQDLVRSRVKTTGITETLLGWRAAEIHCEKSSSYWKYGLVLWCIHVPRWCACSIIERFSSYRWSSSYHWAVLILSLGGPRVSSYGPYPRPKVVPVLVAPLGIILIPSEGMVVSYHAGVVLSPGDHIVHEEAIYMIRASFHSVQSFAGSASLTVKMQGASGWWWEEGNQHARGQHVVDISFLWQYHRRKILMSLMIKHSTIHLLFFVVQITLKIPRVTRLPERKTSRAYAVRLYFSSKNKWLPFAIRSVSNFLLKSTVCDINTGSYRIVRWVCTSIGNFNEQSFNTVLVDTKAEGDPNSFCLKTSRVSEGNIGNFYLLVSTASAPISPQVILNFATPQNIGSQYIVQAITIQAWAIESATDRVNQRISATRSPTRSADRIRKKRSDLCDPDCGTVHGLAEMDGHLIVSGSGNEKPAVRYSLPAWTIVAAGLAISEFGVLLALLAYRLHRRLFVCCMIFPNALVFEGLGTKTSREEFKRDENPDVENAAFEDLHSLPSGEGCRPVSRNSKARVYRHHPGGAAPGTCPPALATTRVVHGWQVRGWRGKYLGQVLA
ncbi:hypothetical protein BDZ89DRAFT_1042390 [Hymenopellis radicata]|nr:hypothetical protein BDZ89DRAFT_1042390 [Hymenopellis radicata]